MSHPDNTVIQTVTIAAGASLSGASTKYPGYQLIGVQTASTWDAAKISLVGSLDGTNFFPVRTASAEYEVASLTGAACVAIDPVVTAPWDYYKIRSGTSGAATNQADDTIVTLIFKPR